MKLSVIIVNYNVKYHVEQCLDSVLRATHNLETEVFVVDNHSRDGSVEYLRARFPQVNIIDNNHNLGFARANNIAIRQSSGEYVLLLNPDTFVAEDSIQQVIAFMDENPKAGGVGVMMHNTEGTRAMESRRALPTPLVSFRKMLGFSNRYYMTHLSWDTPGQIEVISGAFCMLRRTVLDEVGLLDEDFFMYGEDIDLSYRITRGGYQNWYVPARIVHYKGESTQKSSFRYVHVFYQAMLIFFRKHYAHLSVLISIPIKIAIYFRAFLALIFMLTDRMKRSLGFVQQTETEQPFLFVGTDKMLDECRQIARQKGLTAQFVNDLKDLKDLHNTVIVYDVKFFGYKTIIQDISTHHAGQCQLGTYNTQTHVLITPMDIITI